VIGCEYLALGISAGISIRDGFGQDGVIVACRAAIRNFLWSLIPGGVEATGWPLGNPVIDREIEVVVARVSGVRAVSGINLFKKENNDWAKIPVFTLEPWQLPELLSLVVVADDNAAPDNLRGVPNPFGTDSKRGVAVPVVPEVC